MIVQRSYNDRGYQKEVLFLVAVGMGENSGKYVYNAEENCVDAMLRSFLLFSLNPLEIKYR